jgi:hypothetical protein
MFRDKAETLKSRVKQKSTVTRDRTLGQKSTVHTVVQGFRVGTASDARRRTLVLKTLEDLGTVHFTLYRNTGG